MQTLKHFLCRSQSDTCQLESKKKVHEQQFANRLELMSITISILMVNSLMESIIHLH